MTHDRPTIGENSCSSLKLGQWEGWELGWKGRGAQVNWLSGSAKWCKISPRLPLSLPPFQVKVHRHRHESSIFSPDYFFVPTFLDPRSCSRSFRLKFALPTQTDIYRFDAHTRNLSNEDNQTYQFDFPPLILFFNLQKVDAENQQSYLPMSSEYKNFHD